MESDALSVVISLVSQGKYREAEDIIMHRLNENPGDVRARVLLARILYERGFAAFAVRELREALSEAPDNKYIKNLIERLSPGSTKNSIDTNPPEKQRQGEGLKTVAEVEFDLDDID